MNLSFAVLERQRLARCRLLAELCFRRLPGLGGWSHCGKQLGTEPTSLALLALRSSSCAFAVTRKDLQPLLACQRPNGLWPAVGNRTAGVNFWASAMAANTLLILGAAPETLVGALDSLVNCRPLEASWLVRLKFRLSDRQVRFDPAKYGWAWVPDTVSWVVPTSMALITLERAREQGLIRGRGLQERLRLGAEMLINRACPEGGWNAGNAVVYGVPLRPHVDATAIALAALRYHHDEPIVRDSLTWMLNRIDCPSAYSLAWVFARAREQSPSILFIDEIDGLLPRGDNGYYMGQHQIQLVEQALMLMSQLDPGNQVFLVGQQTTSTISIRACCEAGDSPKRSRSASRTIKAICD
jgi:hypothetical protein